MSAEHWGGPHGRRRELARRLREAREFVNLSQQFVAEQTGISRSAISDIERGERRVESLELKRLAELYRMPVDYFLGNEPSRRTRGRQPGTQPSRRSRAQTGEMDPDEKEQVLRFALFLRNYKQPGQR